jgi:uncharacterized protein (DUF362 family)
MRRERRQFIALAAGTAAGMAGAWQSIKPVHRISYLKTRSRVAVLEATAYSRRLEQVLIEGLGLFNLDVRGRSVLLKPNLVEHVSGRPVNTDPMLVGAAASCFVELGAKRVVVGEGPGHERDTAMVVSDTGFEQELRGRGVEFVDLNRDDLVKVTLKANYSGLHHLWLPRTVLTSEFVVSMPKVKTHHWAGVTLSMKNMFGVVPGMKYGWPKNVLHWHGIHESILDICATAPIHFVIADGIQAMEGNGPLQGTERWMNRIVLSDDPVAADATCCRLMGFAPERIAHIAEGARFLGNLAADRITMLAEPALAPAKPFAVLPDFHYLIQPTTH